MSRGRVWVGVSPETVLSLQLAMFSYPSLTCPVRGLRWMQHWSPRACPGLCWSRSGSSALDVADGVGG